MRAIQVGVLVVVLLASGCGLLPQPGGWKVDIVNGPQALLVSIGIEGRQWAWAVAPFARLVLLNENAPPGEGFVEVIDPVACRSYGGDPLLQTSFTIVPHSVDTEHGFDTTIVLMAGASLIGTPTPSVAIDQCPMQDLPPRLEM